MTDKLWKKNEREFAKAIGGERVPVTGRQRGSAPDVAHAACSVECKHRQSIPKWIKEAMEQAVASIKDPEQVPLVQIHEKYQRRENDLIMMRLQDFVKLRWWDDEET